ncbi:MAG TPA: hypothetical protein VK009_01105 [Chloroflexota bacterium]|nr:hypothetical protein [Chloroflexota bacterium]
MPKSRNRNRAPSRPTQQRRRQRKWVKWLALLLPIALLGATLMGIFGVGSAGAGQISVPSPSGAISR